MKAVSVYDAKTHLSQLIGEVEAGGSVTITRNGVPVVQLVRVARPSRDADALRGLVLSVDADAFEPMSEVDASALESAPLLAE